MRLLVTLLAPLLLLLVADAASAQPSTVVPGAPDSYPANLALPPLPGVTPSPMTSLPPPQAIEAETPNTSGQALRRPGYEAFIRSDGSLIFDSKFLETSLTSDPTVGPRFGGSFDLTDLFGYEDPYLQDKLALLDETFAHRAVLRERHTKRALNRAIGDLPAYLAAVWRQEDWDLATRRRLLFALWDECAESGKNEKAGRKARKRIENFIVQALPKYSSQGFSEQEIHTLNAARSSHNAFDPYAMVAAP